MTVQTETYKAHFPGKKEDGKSWVLGDDCHMQKNGMIPICVIVKPDVEGTLFNNLSKSLTTNWVVNKVRVTVTRFWSASTAFINLVCDPTFYY
jgi:hypothetical protein